MTMIGAEHVSEEEVDRRGFRSLLEEAAQRPLAVDGPRGQVLLANAEDAEEVLEDLQDMVVVLARKLSDNGERYNLDEVVAELGLTEEEIEAAED